VSFYIHPYLEHSFGLDMAASVVNNCNTTVPHSHTAAIVYDTVLVLLIVVACMVALPPVDCCMSPS